jgi:MOSC domain-containing protein YiiM
MNMDFAPRTIEAVLTGALAPLPGGKAHSGIAKRRVDEAVWLGATGLLGDEQGDRRHHGGPEKALHHYPREHYARWQAWSGRADLLAAPGAFGENISTTGIDESQVCIGDIFEMSGAVVQLTQGRQPCWRLDARFGETGVAREMQARGHTGWYYRVLTPGWVRAGDTLRLLARAHADWPLSRLIALMFSRDAQHLPDWQRAAELPALSDHWRHTFARRVESRAVEDWDRRLTPPTPAAR